MNQGKSVDVFSMIGFCLHVNLKLPPYLGDVQTQNESLILQAKIWGAPDSTKQRQH